MILLAVVLWTVPVQDTLHLGWLHTQAIASDARNSQSAHLAIASAERTAVLQAARLPQLGLRAQATHQSDVTRVELGVAGVNPPSPPRDRWQAVVQADQLLYGGGTVAGRVALETARLVEQQAGVTVAQHALRGEVDAAFFTAWLLQERLAELTAVDEDLRARLDGVRARVHEGVALPSDTATIEAERLTVLRQRRQAASQRLAALAVLARLADTDIDTSATLVAPPLGPVVARAATGALDTLRARPEFAQLRATQHRLGQEALLAGLENRPMVSAFAEAGVGRPGLNQFQRDPAAFWQGGVRVTWRPWTWRSADRSATALREQAAVVAAEETALAARLARAVEADLALMQQLQDGFVDDARLVALRAAIERTAQLQLDEGLITAAVYVAARTDLLEARLAERRHRAELVRAEAAFLTTLGIPLPVSED